MNPDSGKLHNVDEAFKQLFGRVNREPEESVEHMLERAKKRHTELADGEPAPGSLLPANWPRLEVGQELKQVAGFKLKEAAAMAKAAGLSPFVIQEMTEPQMRLHGRAMAEPHPEVVDH